MKRCGAVYHQVSSGSFFHQSTHPENMVPPQRGGRSFKISHWDKHLTSTGSQHSKTVETLRVGIYMELEPVIIVADSIDEQGRRLFCWTCQRPGGGGSNGNAPPPPPPPPLVLLDPEPNKSCVAFDCAFFVLPGMVMENV